MPIPARILAVVAALLAGGCGARGLVQPGAGAGATGTVSDGHTALAITLVPGFVGNGDGPRTYTLRCAPTSGNVPDAAAACRRLGATPALLAPLAPCAMHLVDAPTERVRGRFGGRSVTLVLGACPAHHARWLELARALGLG
jgi:hypothetical protein